MLWYFIFPLFVFFLATNCYKVKWVGIFLFLLLLFFLMFRGENVGHDTVNYLENCDNVAMIFVENGMTNVQGKTEFLYYWMCIIITLFDWSPKWIIYFLSLINFIFLYYGCRRFKVNMALFCSFYVMSTIYIYSFNIARQVSAMSVGFYALSFITEVNWKKYLFFFWLIIAFLLHNAIIVLGACYFCRYFSFEREKVAKLAHMICPLLIILPIEILVNFIASILERMGVGGMEYRLESGGVSVFSILNKLLYFYLCLFIFKKYSLRKKTDIYDNLFVVSVFVISLSSGGDMMALRMRLCFMLFQCVYFSRYFIINSNIKSREYIWLFLLNIVMVYWVSLLYDPYYMSFNLNYVQND